MDFTIRLTRDGREQQSLDLLRTDIGLIRMDQIRDGLEELQARERDRTTIRVDEWRKSLAFSRLGVAALTALNIVLLVVILRWLKQHWRRGEERALELDKLVRERTDQLARLSAYLQEARDNEKTVLGRELHDELGAILTATRMDLLWVRGHLAPEQDQLLDKLRRAMSNLDQGIAIKRRIIEDLRPSILSNFGLMTATRVIAEQAAERAGWTLELDLPPTDPDLDDDVEIAMFRILQEALDNAAKYARATRLMIALQCVAGESCRLEIEDNGVGFDNDKVGAECHGLAGMRQRLESRGGRLDVRSEPGKGTRVQATLPLRVADTMPG
jgi:signal transduction histidine kinase